jgi:hypothetical protein
MKVRFNFVFIAVIGFIFLGFVGLLETNRANAGLGVFKTQETLLMNRWIVADAAEAISNKNLTDEFKSLSWHFLQSGGFVEFEEQVIEETGKWWLRGQELNIRKKGQEEIEKFVIEKLTQRELLISSAAIKIRLLRFND